MKLNTLAAIVVLAAFPLSTAAQDAKKAPKPTVAAAQKVVKIIGSDKAKLKIYCDMADLGAKMDDAEQKKDTKTFEALADKFDKMAEQLGPEYATLMAGMQDMPEDSKEAEAIAETLGDLDEKCGN